ncbi:hypothetical protein F8N49_23785 [Pseudomonas sp. GXM4]|nr:hypothetical protein F8N49_23785 [Pseudomonas sp. GXM4]PYC04248.1 hypothetical protein DMX04_08265 [Pseudomonas koreensis]
MCRWGIRGRFRFPALWSFEARSKAPHPSPLPEGEGTDRGIFERYTDLKVMLGIHNRCDFSGRCTPQDTSVGPLSLSRRERGLTVGYSRGTPT